MKISELPMAERVTNDDFLPLVQSGETKKANRSQILEGVPNGITQENGVLHLTASGEKVGEGAHLPFWKEIIEKPDTTLAFDLAKADPDTALQKIGKKLGLVIGKTYQIEVIIDGNDPVLVESAAVDGTEQVGFECALMEINNPVPDSSGNIEAYAYIYDGFDMDFVNGTFVKADEAMFTVAHLDTTLVIHDLPETVTTVHKIPAEYLPTDEILNAESIIENIVIDMPFFENQPVSDSFAGYVSQNDWFYITSADAAAGTFKLSYDKNGDNLAFYSLFSLPALDTGNCGILENGFKVQFGGEPNNQKMRLLGEYGTADWTLNEIIPKKAGYDICEFEIAALACADISSGKFNGEGSENIGAIAAFPSNADNILRITSYSVDTFSGQQDSGIEITLRGVSDRPARTYLIHSKGTIDFSNDRVIMNGKTASAGMVQDTSGSVTNTYPHIYDKQVWMYPAQSDYNMEQLVNTVVIGGAFLNGTKIKLTWRKKHE